MSWYDPATGRIHASTVYAHFHEWAHVAQQAENRMLWRLFRWLHPVPVIGRTVNVALEIEAALIARRDLMACGIWEPGDAAQALDGIRAYLADLFPWIAWRAKL